MTAAGQKSLAASLRGLEGGGESAFREVDRLVSLIDSAVSAVEEETLAIRRSGVREIESHAGRKGQSLVSLGRSLPPGSVLKDPIVLDRLRILRSALEKNQAVLKLHMDAVAEVSQIIVRCVRNASSDGTYAPAANHYGRDEW